jgi:hypothetical protein
MSDEVDKTTQKLFEEADNFIKEFDAGYWELTSEAQKICYDDYTLAGKKKKYTLADLLPNAIMRYKLSNDLPEKIKASVKVIGWKTRAISHGVLIQSQNKLKELNNKLSDNLAKEQEERKKCIDRVRFLESEVDRLDGELAVAKANGYIPTGTWKGENA